MWNTVYKSKLANVYTAVPTSHVLIFALGKGQGYKTRQSLTLSSSLFTVTEPSLSQPDLTLKLYEDKRLYFERKGGIQRYRIISDRITSFMSIYFNINFKVFGTINHNSYENDDDNNNN